jgi:BirA family biotin operon repressor/biotin-[acetyl-CoA-carboxylase] ligase
VSTRDRVIAALEEAGEVGLSGEALACELGVSRVAVAKHVAVLRDQGYTIDARPGSGYRLTGVPELALPFEVARHVRDPLWTRFQGGVDTDSTNADARALAKEGAEEGSVVVAARQSAGRGRLGRSWDSPEGGAYVSVVLRPGLAPAEMGPLALVVGLGIARGIETIGAGPRLKWPNDVLLGEGKLAGVLLEMAAEGDRVDWVVAGFGINVRRGEARAQNAAYLEEAVPSADPSRVAAAALDGVAEAYRRWREAGFDVLLPEYLDRFALTGDEVLVRDSTGTVRAEGIVEGVDAQGRLLVRSGSGAVTLVATGEVTLCRDA